MAFRRTVSELTKNADKFAVRNGSRQGCHKSRVSDKIVGTASYSQDIRSNPSVGCPMHDTESNNPSTLQQKHRYKSSAATVDAIDISTATTSHSKPFNEIPLPGGYEKGLMGILAPMYHAWRGEAFTRPHEYMRSCFKELGPIFRQNTLMGWIVNITDPDDMERVFRAVGKYPNRPIIECWVHHREEKNLSAGLLTSDHETWHKLRSAVSKGILKPSALVSHVHSMHEVVLEFIDKVRTIRRPDGVIPDIETELYKWAMESSSTFFYDKRLNLIKEKQLRKENQDFFDALQILTWDTAKLYAFPEQVLNAMPESRNPVTKSNKSWDTIFALTKEYIDEKMATLAKKAVRDENLDDGTFVAFLMLEDKLTKDEIYGVVAEIMTGSVDTTANTSALLIHEVSQKAEIQEKLYEEQMRLNPEGAVPTAELLDSMSYLKATIKETQRLYPITLATARILEEDIVIHGYNIPKGVHIATNFYNACRDPKIFDDPMEFRPERWLQTTRKYHPFASMPFGHGTRMCVGRRLAQQEMYLLLSEIIRNFKLVATKPDLVTNCGVTIHPATSSEPKMIERQK